MLGQGRLIKAIMALSLATGLLAGCSSNKKKLEQREKAAAASGLYCDFVNGDKHKEVELELNLAMAARCDSEKPYSISDYRNAAEVHGMLFCCSMKKRMAQAQMMENKPVSQPKAQPDDEKAPTTTTTEKSDLKSELTGQ